MKRYRTFVLVALVTLVACEDQTLAGPEAQEVFAQVTAGLSAGAAASESDERINIGGTLAPRVSPLIFIDGKRVGGGHPSVLNDITPQDIESIEVIKGSRATEQYGPDARSGVILITLKEEAREGLEDARTRLDDAATWLEDEGRNSKTPERD